MKTLYKTADAIRNHQKRDLSSIQRSDSRNDINIFNKYR